MKEVDENEIITTFDTLKKACKGCTDNDLDRLDQAFNYAKSIYGNQLSANGEPRIVQSLNIANIVSSEIGLRAASVISAILHDIINTHEENLTEVEKLFGRDIATIIQGFKKISGLHSEKVSLQSENFRSLFFNTVDDVRIIFIKLAHRLYDMRNFHKLPVELQKWYLADVKFLYIPIAHRLGLYQIKAELEDHEFKNTNPADYNMIASKLKKTKQEQEKYIQRFIRPIQAALEEENIQFEIKSRAKTISSIKKKMDKQGVDLDGVFDLFAIRVILTNSLSEEEYKFIDDFHKYIEEKGDPRLARRGKRERYSEADKSIDEKELREELEIEKEMRREKLQDFEIKHRRYVELMHAEKTACWKAYSLITNIYSPNPKRLRDWVSAPKASGYESLHTTVLGPENRSVEVQIRTARMDEHAEKGSAAHWRYKESAYGKDVGSWMNDIRQVLETMGVQKLDEGAITKVGNASDKIYVFTNQGDLRELRNGSTILDFAFDIHSALGSTCIGGKVNGKAVPIRYELQNGDRVEVITSKKQKPNTDWLKYVVTPKAKSRINRAIRDEKFKEAEGGKETLLRKLKNWKIDFSDQNLNKIIKHYSFHKPIDLYFNIALGKVDLLEIKQIFRDSVEIDDNIDALKKPFELSEEFIESQSEKDQGYILIEAGVSDLNYSLAKCCNPIAGDRIFGFVTVHSGIKIHRFTCPNALQLREKYPYRIIKSKWKETKNMQFFATNLRILGMDRMGLLNDITQVISNDLKVNMRDLSIKTKGNNFEGIIKVQIRDLENLGFLKQKILKIKGVTKVVRFD